MDRPSDTRAAIISAFNRMVLRTRRTRPPIAQLLKEAGVARSTLYSHFDDRNALLLEAMRSPLSVIADTVVGACEHQRLVGLLDHLWEQRRGASDLLAGALSNRVVRTLAELIVARAPLCPHADALRIADSQIGFIRLWISGDTPTTSDLLARKMSRSASAQRIALQDEAHDRLHGVDEA